MQYAVQHKYGQLSNTQHAVQYKYGQLSNTLYAVQHKYNNFLECWMDEW
jgi:hypothetical protein